MTDSLMALQAYTIIEQYLHNKRSQLLTNLDPKTHQTKYPSSKMLEIDQKCHQAIAKKKVSLRAVIRGWHTSENFPQVHSQADL